MDDGDQGHHPSMHGHHHPLIIRFHQTGGPHDQHMVRWSVPSELSLGVYHGVTILNNTPKPNLISSFFTRNLFLSQEINSCHKKSILGRRLYLLWLSLLYQLATLRESCQKVCLSLYISWEPGSQVPHEYSCLNDQAYNCLIHFYKRSKNSQATRDIDRSAFFIYLRYYTTISKDLKMIISLHPDGW